MNLLSFFSNLDTIVFAIVFLLVLFFFLRDFKITSKQSWVVLIGLTALGGLFAFQTWKRKQMLKEFEEREKRLHDLERRYEVLQKAGKISEAALAKAREELAAEKKEAAAATVQADKKLAEGLAVARKENLESSDDEFFNYLERKGINLR